MTVIDSKSSSSVSERNMYAPFADAMNHALEHLSKIQVDGLPGFTTPIVFVPCGKSVSSDRDSPGAACKPDLAIMTLEDACEIYGLNELDAPKVSEFVNEIPNGFVSWRTILSVVEMERKRGTLDCTRGANQDEETDIPQPTTSKIDAFPYEHPLI